VKVTNDTAAVPLALATGGHSFAVTTARLPLSRNPIQRRPVATAVAGEDSDVSGLDSRIDTQMNLRGDAPSH
jgi:hypothetical protein